MCLVLNQLLYCLHNSICHLSQQQFALIVILLSHSSAYTITIVCRSLIRRSSNHNYSLYTHRVFTQDWQNSLWITVCWSVLPVIMHCKESDECTWRIISLPSRNLYRCKQVIDVIAVCVFCWHLFDICLLVYSLFYINVVAIFLFIRWSCKQVHCFVSGALVYHFNNTISIFVKACSNSFVNIVAS